RHLPFQMQFGAPADHVTDGLVIARGRGFGLARLFLFPDTHRNMNARSEILLPHLPLRRILRLDLLDACVSHFASCGNQPRRKEEREERIEKNLRALLFFVVDFYLSPRHLSRLAAPTNTPEILCFGRAKGRYASGHRVSAV